MTEVAQDAREASANHYESLRRSLVRKYDGRTRLLVERGRTKLCFDAFPRSGNTTLVQAITTSTTLLDREVAHHLHSIDNLQLGLVAQIPVASVVRDPLASLSSYHVYMRSPADPNMHEAFVRRYEVFTRYLLKHREEILIFRFEDCIGDLPSFVRTIARYAGAEPLTTDDAQIRKRIADAQQAGAETDPTRISRPDSSRKALNEAARAVYAAMDLTKALSLYHAVSDGLEQPA